MKKFIAFSVALMMLLFGFTATVDVAEVENGIQVCDDLEPKPEPYDQICL